MFTKAKKSQGKARIALIGVSGSGKTYTSLITATALGGRIALIDTENNSASKYADEFDFDVANLTNYHPDNYIRAIKAAEDAGYNVLIIDSLSHAWFGPDGVLEMVDKAVAQQRGNRFTPWRDATPAQNRLVQTILGSNMHIIATMRSRSEWVLVDDERGRKVPQKVGTEPIQRKGIEYEFDIVAEIDINHKLTVVKTRCRALDNYTATNPDSEFGTIVKRWLDDGVPIEELPATEAHLHKLVEAAANVGIIDGNKLKELVYEVTGKEASRDLTIGDVKACLLRLEEKRVS